MFSPATTAAVPALGAAALRLLAVCRSRHGQAVGLSMLARLVGLPRERTGEELQELMYHGLVIYRSATEPLHAPASPPPATPARRIKVATHFKQLKPRLAITAKLMLQGDWLAAAGFAPGTVAQVEVQAGRLIITTAPVQ